MAGKQLTPDQAMEILAATARKNVMMRLAITVCACAALLVTAFKACSAAVCT